MSPSDIQQAIALFQSGNLESARQILTEFLVEYPDDLNANMLSAAISASDEDYDSVVIACNKVLSLDAGNVGARYNAAVASEKLQRFEEAEKYARDVVDIAPSNANARLLCIRSMFANGRIEKAVEFAESSLAQFMHEELLQSVFEIFVRHGQSSTFKEMLDRAKALDGALLRYYSIISAIEAGEESAIVDDINALMLVDSTGSLTIRARLYLHYRKGMYSDFLTDVPSLANSFPVSDMLLYRKLVDVCLAKGEYAVGVNVVNALLSTGVNLSEHYHNLSIFHDRSGDQEAAIVACESALSIAPGSLNTRYNLAFLHNQTGNKTAALQNIRLCVEASNDVQYAEAYVELLSNADVVELNDQDIEMISRLVADDRLDPQILSSLVINILIDSSDLIRVLFECNDDEEFVRILSKKTGQLTNISLLQDFYNNLPITRYDFEVFTRRLRRGLLEQYIDSGVLGSASQSLCCSLGVRGFINGFVFLEHQDETRIIDSIINKWSDTGDASIESMVIVAMYRRLFDVMPKLPEQSENNIPEFMSALFKLHVDDRVLEDELARDIRVNGEILDETSLRVKQQYEGNPYPVWQRLTRRQPRPLRKVLLSDLSPEINTARIPENPDVLIAGCGTGSHALQVAMRYTVNSITAIDLSMRSLAFASRKAREYGYENINFSIMDILNIQDLGKQFDVIESVGVIHHMEEPQDGLNRLVSVLKPGGLFNLGFYSKSGRRYVIQAKQRYDDHSRRLSDDEIRMKRLQIIEESSELSDNITGYKDFFTLDDCRDLIFHENENNYDTLELAEMINKAGLEFMGFEHYDKSVMPRYRAMFPDDPFGLSLNNWFQFEQKYPDTFASMYMFWCRKPG